MSGFLNKVKDGLNKSVASAGAHSKAMMDKVKINTVISNLEKERLQLVQMLGQNIYDIYKAQGNVEANESITKLINEIDRRLESISYQHDQIEQVENELKLVIGGAAHATAIGSTCVCGYENNPNAKFCAGCGEQMTNVIE